MYKVIQQVLENNKITEIPSAISFITPAEAYDYISLSKCNKDDLEFRTIYFVRPIGV
jgi:hypothetical protein